MGTTYGQLTLNERIELYRLHADGKALRAIAQVLGRSPSTLSRELRRNSRPTKTWPGGYDAVRAQKLTLRRRRWDARSKLARQPALREHVRRVLAMGWSPEQIAGRLALEKDSMRISYESIYRYIYSRTAQKDYWHKLLPRQKFSRGRSRRRSYKPTENIKDRVSIDLRPEAANDRKEEGHWETDYILFKTYGQSVLVAQERSTRFMMLAKPPNRKAAQTVSILLHWFSALPQRLRRTLTQDNGTEFAEHYKLKALLGLLTFFCKPHAPWQKGGVENANGRLRRDLPRKMDISTLSEEALKAIADRHNNTPRKCLGYKTPAELFSSLLLHFNRESTSPPSRG